MQLESLNVAINNLNSHSKSLVALFDEFKPFANKELFRNSQLLHIFPIDLETLRLIDVNQSILANKGSKNLLDFVPVETIRIWADNCKVKHDQFDHDFKNLSDSVYHIKMLTDQELSTQVTFNLQKMDSLSNLNSISISEIDRTLKLLERRFLRIAKFIDENKNSIDDSKFQTLQEYSKEHETQYLPELLKADETIRESLSFYIDSKNNLSQHLITRLQSIADIESAIAQTNPIFDTMSQYTFPSMSQAFSQLLHVHRMAPAWGASLIEIVRRKEFTRMFVNKSKMLVEIFEMFKEREQKRREKFSTEIARYLPNNLIQGLDEHLPSFDITFSHSQESRLPDISLMNIQELENQIPLIKSKLDLQLSNNDNTLLQNIHHQELQLSALNQQQKPIMIKQGISKLLTTLQTVGQQIGAVSNDFDDILAKSGVSLAIRRDSTISKSEKPSSIRKSSLQSAGNGEELEACKERIRHLERLLEESYLKAVHPRASETVQMEDQTLKIKNLESTLTAQKTDLKVSIEKIGVLEKDLAYQVSLALQGVEWKKRAFDSEKMEQDLESKIRELETQNEKISLLLNDKIGDDSEQIGRVHVILSHLARLLNASSIVDTKYSDDKDPSQDSDDADVGENSFSTFLDDVEDLLEKRPQVVNLIDVYDASIDLVSICKSRNSANRKRIEDYETSLEDKYEEIQAKDGRIKRLELEIRLSFKDKEDHKLKMEALTTELEGLKRRLLESNAAEIELFNIEIVSLKADIEKKSREITDLEVMLRSKNEAIDLQLESYKLCEVEMQKRISDLISDLQRTVTKRDLLNVEFETKLIEEELKIVELNRQGIEKQAIIDSVKKKLESLFIDTSTKIDSLEIILNDQIDEIDLLKEEVSKKSQSESSLRQKIDELSNKIVKYKSENINVSSKLEIEVQKHLSEIETLKQTHASLVNSLNEKNSALQLTLRHSSIPSSSSLTTKINEMQKQLEDFLIVTKLANDLLLAHRTALSTLSNKILKTILFDPELLNASLFTTTINGSSEANFNQLVDLLQNSGDTAIDRLLRETYFRLLGMGQIENISQDVNLLVEKVDRISENKISVFGPFEKGDLVVVYADGDGLKIVDFSSQGQRFVPYEGDGANRVGVGCISELIECLADEYDAELMGIEVGQSYQKVLYTICNTLDVKSNRSERFFGRKTLRKVVSVESFDRDDLVLFLPRKKNPNCWKAFTIGGSQNFYLKQVDRIPQINKKKGYIVAKISKVEEEKTSDETFGAVELGLLPGSKYFLCSVSLIA